MNALSLRLRILGVAFTGALLLSGCSSNKDGLYYWGDYQPEVHDYFTGEKSPDEQILKLEAGIEKARSLGKPLPPGYQAHLGLLYAQKEQGDKMQQYFDAEKAQYPESATYIDFLLSTKTKAARQGASK